jgi:DNA-binding LytR/AlgR family response regulator
MTKRLNQLVQQLKKESGLFLSIGLCVFIFVLFFQPFPNDRFDFNNRLLFVAGLGVIIFLIITLVRIVLPWLIKNNSETNGETFLPSYLNSIIILASSSVAFVFYLDYVGWVSITFYIVFKVVLICLVPPVVLRIYDVINELKNQNASLVIEKKILQKKIEQFEEDYLNKSIEFISENINENFSLQIAEVVLIRSAGNYVEIVYKEGDDFKKKLIRNTIKNIELQIKPYTNFIRCHRICIVNAHYIEKLNRNYSNHWLSIKGFDDQIPVSRQYLLKLREAL